MRKPKNQVLSFLVETVDLYFTKRVSRSSAELAYFLVLSFFPVLICVNAFIGSLRLDPQAVFGNLTGVLPESVAGILTDYLN